MDAVRHNATFIEDPRVVVNFRVGRRIRKQLTDPSHFVPALAQMRLDECAALTRNLTDPPHQFPRTCCGKSRSVHVSKASAIGSVPPFAEPLACGNRGAGLLLKRCRRIPIHHDFADESADDLSSSPRDSNDYGFI